MGLIKINKQLDKLSNGNDNVKKNLIDLIINQTTAEVENLKINLQKKNWNSVIQTVHKLKSTFMYLQIERAENLSESILNLTVNDAKEIEELTNELLPICENLIQLLSQN